MRITHNAIDRPRVVIVGVLLVMAMAAMAAVFIPVQRTPAIDTAVVIVSVPYPGAEPTRVETEITRKIEEALERLDKVDEIQSTSMRGSSVVSVLFEDGVGAKRARDDVAHLVDQVRALLPQGREVQPIITDIDFESLPIALVNLSGPPDFDERTLKQIAEDVEEELRAVEGVSNTQLFGGREREIHVNVNPDLFNEYGFSLPEIFRAVSDFHSKLPGGSFNTSEYDYQIRNETDLEDVDDIRAAVVTEREGRLIRIRDIAEVKDTYRRLKNVAQLNGRDTATIIVYKESDINTLETAEAIHRRVENLQGEYPHITFSVTRDVSEDIRIMFEVLGSSALFGAMLVLIILMWTMGFRISILVLMAIPFSMAIGLIFLFAAEIPISNMAIFSFILVLGMVVDGAIIVAENIHRHIERGEPPVVASKRGIDEVGLPVIAADLTTVAAFLPMLLVPGIMGDFMSTMPKVVSVALLGSVIVDHFLIPVLAAYWYREKKPGEEEQDADVTAAPMAEGDSPDPADRATEGDSPIFAERKSGQSPGGGGEKPLLHPEAQIRPNHGYFTRVYARLLRFSLAHRWVVVVCCVVALVWAFATFGTIGFVFFPKSDRGQFEISYELPLGYSIEETLAAAKVLTDPLDELEKSGDLVNYVTAVGSSQGLAQRLDLDPATGPEFGKIMVQLTSPTVRKRHQEKIIAEVREKIERRRYPGMKYRIDEVKEGPPGGSDVAIRLTGDDLDQLGRLGLEIAARLENVAGTTEVSCDYRPDSPELVVEPHPELVGLFGLSESEVGQAVQTAILGNSAIQLTLDDEDVTLRLQAAPEYQRTKQDVERLMLTSRTGRRATVGQLADIRRVPGLYAVNRFDRSRAVTVRANVTKEAINPEKDREYIPDDVFEVLREEILPEMNFEPVEPTPGGFQAIVNPVIELFGGKPLKDPVVSFLGAPVSNAEGVRAAFTGQNEDRDENFAYLVNSMAVGVILIFAILVVQFNSFRQTVVVLGAVPLSFVGVIFGMWVCGHPFSLASFIGLICLAGIVVNDAIVLVDFTNQARRRGMQVRHALLEAGINRLRPVLLTTVTTIGGLLPLFLNVSGGAEFWQPLTGAVIFGLAFSTVLTLLVIPTAYSLAYNWADRLKHS